VDGGVVVLTAEDGLDDTVLPRLLAARGDPRRVLALDVVGTGREEHDPMLPDDLGSVEAAIKRVDAVLVIVDPLMAFLPGSVNAHRDQDVRRALRQLASLAERTSAAILVVRHLNKVTGGNAITRGGGSIGIIGAARAGLLVAKDPENEDERVLAVTKSNLGPPVGSLKYALEGVTYPTDDGTGEAVRVRWLGASTMTADGLLAALAEDADEKTLVQEVMNFLDDYLRTPQPAEPAKRAAVKATGASERTVMTAKKKLGVRSRKLGMGDGWVWALADDEDDSAGKVVPLPTKGAATAPKNANDAKDAGTPEPCVLPAESRAESPVTPEECLPHETLHPLHSSHSSGVRVHPSSPTQQAPIAVCPHPDCGHPLDVQPGDDLVLCTHCRAAGRPNHVRPIYPQEVIP
jgi:hypothetical protein